MDVIVFLLVVLGMTNAMTMATYERIFELGIMSALGTRPSQVLATIVLESLFLGLVSLATGLLLASAVIVAAPADSSWGPWANSTSWASRCPAP